MKIEIRDKKTGIIYSSDMSDENDNSILSINFCTSYTEVEVQDRVFKDGVTKFPTHTIILPPLGSSPNWVDLIATQEDNEGEWINHLNH